jgi:hypothetical protein
MPQIPEAPVLLVGTIVSARQTNGYADNPQTGKSESTGPDGGLRLTVRGELDDLAVAIIKVTADQVRDLQPVPGQRVAWFIRYGAYTQDRGAGVSCGLVRPANMEDANAILELVPVPAGK